MDNLANMVLHIAWASNNFDVAVSYYLNSEGEMVSILFRNGENLGAVYFIRNGILLSS